MVLLDIGIPGTSREIHSEDADGKTRTHYPSVINRVLYTSSYTAQRPIAGNWS